MVTIGSLIIPILVSSVLVFFASFLIWAVLPWHKNDFSALPDEAAAANALRGQNLSPGRYLLPKVDSPADMKKPEVAKKYEDGPVAMLTVWPNGIPNMGKQMGQAFAYYLVVGVIAAYLASRTLDGDANYLTVFRISGTAAFLAYGLGTVQDAIWFGRPWASIWKNLVDALVYALLTAGTFGWLWPN